MFEIILDMSLIISIIILMGVNDAFISLIFSSSAQVYWTAYQLLHTFFFLFLFFFFLFLCLFLIFFLILLRCIIRLIFSWLLLKHNYTPSFTTTKFLKGLDHWHNLPHNSFQCSWKCCYEVENESIIYILHQLTYLVLVQSIVQSHPSYQDLRFPRYPDYKSHFHLFCPDSDIMHVWVEYLQFS